MPRKNRQWVLVARPDGMVSESCFELREGEAPEPREGEFLVRNLILSVDPAMRAWMERDTYIPKIPLGEVMRGACVAEVVESKHPDYEPGELVLGEFGWQDYAVSRGGGIAPVMKIPPGVPLTLPLSVLGLTGLTAYFGMLDVGRPRPGETVVVSGAAGATGSVAGQLAKLAGCRVIGIAGGLEKCAWLTEEAHFDAAIDYKAEDVARRLGELCPQGIDVYFDNVGGAVLDAALMHIAQRGRVVLCGAISGYNEKEPPPGPRFYPNLIVRRGRMEGFIVLDYAPRFGEAIPRLLHWVQAGQIAHREDVADGLERAPEALVRLFRGQNFGKQLVRIAEPGQA